MTPEALSAIHSACFPVRPWSAQEFRDLLSKPTTRLFTTACERGFAIVQVVAGEAELLSIAVAPEAQRKGIAAALMQKLLTNLASENAERLFLEVARDNSPARALYEAFGFAQVGLRKGYYAEAVDALVLSREIMG